MTNIIMKPLIFLMKELTTKMKVNLLDFQTSQK